PKKIRIYLCLIVSHFIYIIILQTPQQTCLLLLHCHLITNLKGVFSFFVCLGS
ncbi:hypothetical protein F4808DRAFT_416090, partial [Astrocystis sublimbata]